MGGGIWFDKNIPEMRMRARTRAAIEGTACCTSKLKGASPSPWKSGEARWEEGAEMF